SRKSPRWFVVDGNLSSAVAREPGRSDQRTIASSHHDKYLDALCRSVPHLLAAFQSGVIINITDIGVEPADDRFTSRTDRPEPERLCFPLLLLLKCFVAKPGSMHHFPPVARPDVFCAVRGLHQGRDVLWQAQLLLPVEIR